MIHIRLLLTLISFTSLTVYSQKPVADFKVNVEHKCGYVTTEYINQSVNADTFLWDTYDIGYYTEIYEPRGTNFSSDKEWTVTLIAIGNGLRDTVSKLITVSQTRLDFDYAFVTNQYAPAKVQFINKSQVIDEDTLQYTWNFGNDSTSKQVSPVYTYQQPGTYYFTLNGKKNDNCELSISDYLVVKDTAQRGEAELNLSGCYDGYEYLECSKDIQYEITSDSITFKGYYYGNCGTHKTATIRQRMDSVFFRIWETGPLTTCNCGFCFNVSFPFKKDSAIVIYKDEVLSTNIIPDDYKKPTIKIYPKPADDILNIDLSKPASGSNTYTIVNMNGKKLQTGELNKEHIHLNRSKLANGVYILIIYDNSKVLLKEKILLD
jgi:hypothetical protein